MNSVGILLVWKILVIFHLRIFSLPAHTLLQRTLNRHVLFIQLFLHIFYGYVFINLHNFKLKMDEHCIILEFEPIYNEVSAFIPVSEMVQPKGQIDLIGNNGLACLRSVSIQIWRVRERKPENLNLRASVLG